MTGAARKEGTSVPDNDTDEWMVTVDAARHCKMSKRALLEHVAQGRLKPDSRARPGFKVHRFLRSSLDRFLKGQDAE